MITNVNDLGLTARGLLSRLNEIAVARQVAVGDLTRMKGALELERGRRDELVAESDLNQAAQAVTERLVAEMSAADLSALVELLNWGIGCVFFDRSYRVEIKVDRSRGAPVIIPLLHEVIHGEEVESEIRDEVGGGIRAVIGLIFQVFYLKSSGAPRVIIMDESLSAVSIDYMERLFDLIGLLRDRMGFTFLLISHDPRILEYGDKTYQVSDGAYTLKKGAEPCRTTA